VCDLIARETSFWEPGTRSGYHGLTFGWLVGEVVRRISGRSLGAFFQEEIAGPLGLDFWIGLPEAHEPRAATVIANRPRARDPQSAFLKAVLSEPDSPASLFSLNTGGANANTRAFRAAELGSMGGVTNARGLAGLYAPLANGGAWKGVTLFDEHAVQRMGAVSMESARDETLLMPMRFALGFVKTVDNRSLPTDPPTESLIMGEAAFGHPGRGGSMGFADPDCRMSFGYVMNNLGLGVLVNERGQRLIDAAYASVL
jgi:CubicO group peptidase (beta-lactamase class C family)